VSFLWNLLDPRIQRLIASVVIVGLALVGVVNARVEQRLARSVLLYVAHTVCVESVRPLADQMIKAIEDTFPTGVRKPQPVRCPS
jgi:hypothetical protein